MSAEKKKFSWGAVPATQSVSLSDVMSEELADHLHKQELAVFGEPEHQPLQEHVLPPESPSSTEDDFLIAQMLQKQYDKEFDVALDKEENHMNGSSKVRVSYSKYKMIPEDIIWDDSDDEEDFEYFNQDDHKRDWDRFETNDKEIGNIPRCGYKKIGDKMVTKHDKEITQRENAKRIMEFPPGIHTGDGGGFDMQVSNKVYNKIRNFSVKEGKRKNRIQDKEDKAVAEQAMDPKTRVLLFKFVNGGVLDSINGVISTGKEAVIMHADGGPGPEEGPDIALNVPKECAIKVFKTTLNEFKTRDKYIRDDYRFKDRFGKQNPRKIIHMWAEKELHNLMKMAKGGIRVPDVVVLKKHVLVMSFIGNDGKPAPKLKDAVERMTKAQVAEAYNQVLSIMVDLYNVCQLVHADLSEYNILWYDGDCWIIDVSQSVEPIHPSGLNFLYRDCTNISNFFNKWGVPDVLSATELFNKITDLELREGSEADLLSQINGYQKDQELKGGFRVENFEGGFEYCWDQLKNGTPTPSKPIPGHHRAKHEKSAAKSPRSPKSPGPLSKSPGPLSKSPHSDLVSLTDRSLQDLKISLLAEKSREEGKETDGRLSQTEKKPTVTFNDSK